MILKYCKCCPIDLINQLNSPYVLLRLGYRYNNCFLRNWFICQMLSPWPGQ